MRAVLALALRTLAREGRSGDLAVLFLALFVAVAALTGVGFLVDRVDRAMRLQASEVLGADLRLQAQDAIDARYADEARHRGLDTTHITYMLSVILKGDLTQLANVNAVAANYPLRGQVQLATQAFGTQTPADGIPAQGEVWPDSRLLAALDVKVGESISVGSAELRVTRVLISRPDQGSGFVDLAPALLMNEADLPATQLIQPGSRVGYAALFAGERNAIEQFSKWLTQQKKPGERLRDIAEASPEVGNAAQRAGRFLSLASLVGVLLCAVAIAMTARRYVKRHLDLAALLKTLGATRGTVLAISLVQLICIALIAAAAGALAGYLAQQGLLTLLKGMIAAELPAPSLRPLWMGFSAALLLLVGCALPPILQLARVPAIRVLRRDIGPPPLTTLLAYGPCGAGDRAAHPVGLGRRLAFGWFHRWSCRGHQRTGVGGLVAGDAGRAIARRRRHHLALRCRQSRAPAQREHRADRGAGPWSIRAAAADHRAWRPGQGLARAPACQSAELFLREYPRCPARCIP